MKHAILITLLAFGLAFTESFKGQRAVVNINSADTGSVRKSIDGDGEFLLVTAVGKCSGIILSLGGADVFAAHVDTGSVSNRQVLIPCGTQTIRNLVNLTVTHAAVLSLDSAVKVQLERGTR